MATSKPILEFSFTADADRCADGYGYGMLKLDGRPYWYAGTQDEPKPVEWTWVDFLEHIAAIWPALIAEQTYPFEWMVKSISHPGEIWKQADERWRRVGDKKADEEEPVVYEFQRRHNLAAGWKGLGLPALTWLRVGNNVWLSPEEGQPYRALETECRKALQDVGDRMATAFQQSTNPRVAAAVRAWKEKEVALAADFLTLATGFSKSELAELEKGFPSDEYWEVPRVDGWTQLAANENELLAAARMVRDFIPIASVAKIIEKIREVPKKKTPKLDSIGALAGIELKKHLATTAHDSGYQLAQWARKHFRLSITKYFDIENVLGQYNVDIKEFKFGKETSHVEALAFWGAHGPCIVLNENRSYKMDERRRMTLAHEFCHLLVDRANALPAAEVLGGGVDDFVERRANAFGAELLMPREALEREKERGKGSLADLLELRKHYRVSKSVACAQIYNSSVYAYLKIKEQDEVLSLIHYQALAGSEKVVSAVV